MTNPSLSVFEPFRQTISNLAQEEGIDIKFSKGKRKNDILVMSLNTKQSKALIFYLKVSKEFPKYLVQIFRSQNPEKRGLTAALIEPKSLKETDAFFQERRRNFFANEDTSGNWEKFLEEKD